MKKTNYIFVFLVITVLGCFSCSRSGRIGHGTPVRKMKPASRPLFKYGADIPHGLTCDSVYAAAKVWEDASVVPDKEEIFGLNGKNVKMPSANTAVSFLPGLFPVPHVRAKMPVIFQIDFDNDIFDETDYYYTNGVRLSLTTPAEQNSPLYKLLVRPRKTSLLFTGFSLRQNMYTPTDPDVTVILKGDHPFAGYLVLGQFNRAVDFRRKINLFSEITLGVIGPASMAGSVQYALHEKKPEGWINQIRNDIVVNYRLLLEKSVISTPHAELNINLSGRAGTLYDDASAGLLFRAGSFMPVYRGIVPLTGTIHRTKRFQYWFFVKADAKGVLYNATLQGGMFSTSPYTLTKNEINRTLFTASAGVAVYYDRVGLELENFYQTPQFKGAYDFRWGRIKIAVRL